MRQLRVVGPFSERSVGTEDRALDSIVELFLSDVAMVFEGPNSSAVACQTQRIESDPWCGLVARTVHTRCGFGSYGLPAIRRMESAGTAQAVLAAAGHGAPLGRRSRVLLVEDDSALAEMYALGLDIAGYDVTVASDGKRGLALALASRFDLILLDLGMPKLDGFGVLAAIGLDEHASQVPVVILSNYDQPEQIDKARQLGAKDYLVKSQTTPPRLAARIPEWVTGGDAV